MLIKRLQCRLYECDGSRYLHFLNTNNNNNNNNKGLMKIPQSGSYISII